MNKYLLFFFLLLAGGTLPAQPLNLDTTVKPVELKLIKFNPRGKPAGKGWLNLTRVSQVKDTSYFFCKGVSIYSPVAVIVTAKDKGVPLQVSLHKWNWKEASRNGSTNAGIWKEQFKTENDFGIKVIAANRPAEYTITVWVGEEADPDLPSEFKPYDESGPTPGGSSSSGSFFKKNLLYIIIAVLGIAVAFLLFKRKK